MNHQFIEEWLFADEPLTQQEKAQLQEHLSTCAACRQLASAWSDVEGSLHRAAVESPAPGFASRWQARLEADRLRLHRRQSLAILAFSLGGAVLLLASLLIVLWPMLNTPDVLLWVWLSRLLGLISLLEDIEQSVGALFHSASVAIPPLVWVLIAGLLTELAVLWVVSFRLLTNPRRVTR